MISYSMEELIVPTVKCVERKIQQVEHFRADFFKNGVNLRDDKENIPQYPFSAAASGSWTVSEWISKRFKNKYPGYDVRVYTSEGKIADSRMILSNIRK